LLFKTWQGYALSKHTLHIFIEMRNENIDIIMCLFDNSLTRHTAPYLIYNCAFYLYDHHIITHIIFILSVFGVQSITFILVSVIQI
jgi:hypothetical protein